MSREASSYTPEVGMRVRRMAVGAERGHIFVIERFHANGDGIYQITGSYEDYLPNETFTRDAERFEAVNEDWGVDLTDPDGDLSIPETPTFHVGQEVVISERVRGVRTH